MDYANDSQSDSGATNDSDVEEGFKTRHHVHDLHQQVVNGWSDDAELYVYQWRRHLDTLSIMHQIQAKGLFWYGQAIKVPLLVTSAIAGSIGLVELTTTSDAQPAPESAALPADDAGSATPSSQHMSSSHVVIILSGVLSIVVAILTSLHNTLQFDVKGHQHLLASRNYQKMTLSIDVMVCMPRSRREKASVFIDRLIYSFTNQSTTAPVLSTREDTNSSLPSPIIE